MRSNVTNVIVIPLLMLTCAAYAADTPPNTDAVQKAAAQGNAAAVQGAVTQGADKLTPEDALNVLDLLRQRAKFEGTMSDHILIQKAVDTLKAALEDLTSTKKKLAELKDKVTVPDKKEDPKKEESKGGTVSTPQNVPPK